MELTLQLRCCFIFLQGLAMPVLSLLPPAIYTRSIFKSNCQWKHNCKSNGQALEATVTPSPQLLEFREPLTNVTVVLIGSMHYNPTSIRLASDTVQELGQSNRLGSVVVESCDIRWNKTLELYDEKPFLKSLLGNEMRAAQEEAFAFDLPVILGDQRINITSAAMKHSLKETFIDLFTPPTGWQRFKEEFSLAWDEAVPSGDSQYLSPLAFLDPKLLFAIPVSLVKYPLSFLIRDPIPTSVAFALLFGLSYTGTDDSITIGALLDGTSQITFTEYAANLALAALETVVFARLLLKPLLADRNVVLAQNILQQCKLYEVESTNTDRLLLNKGGWGWFSSLLNNGAEEGNAQRVSTQRLLPDDVVYAQGSPLNNVREVNEREEKVVVAVLGMAHLNGVMKLLKEQRV